MSEYGDAPKVSREESIAEEIRRALGDKDTGRPAAAPGEARVRVPAYAFAWAAERASHAGGRLVLHAAEDDRDLEGGFRVVAPKIQGDTCLLYTSPSPRD